MKIRLRRKPFNLEPLPLFVWDDSPACRRARHPASWVQRRYYLSGVRAELIAALAGLGGER